MNKLGVQFLWLDAESITFPTNANIIQLTLSSFIAHFLLPLLGENNRVILWLLASESILSIS